MTRIKYSPIHSDNWEEVSFGPKPLLALPALIKDRFTTANQETGNANLTLFDMVAFKKNDLLAILNRSSTCRYLSFSHIKIKDFNQSTLLATGETSDEDPIDLEGGQFIGTPHPLQLDGVTSFSASLAQDLTFGIMTWTIAPVPSGKIPAWLTAVKQPKFRNRVSDFEKVRLSKEEFIKIYNDTPEDKWIGFFPSVFHCKVKPGNGFYLTGDYCTLIAVELNDIGKPMNEKDFKLLILVETWRPNWPRTPGEKGLHQYLTKQFNKLLNKFLKTS